MTVPESSGPELSNEAVRKLMLMLDYEGPWERLSGFFYGVRPDNTLRWDIPDNARGWRAVLGRLGEFCDRRDVDWRRSVVAGRRPHERWRRRGPRTD